MNSIRSVVIVAKPGPLRDGLKALISSITSVHSLDMVDNHQAISKLSSSGPVQLIILQSDGSGERVWNTLREIRSAAPQCPCMVLVEEVYQLESIEAENADVVLLQGMPPNEIIATVERYLRGTIE